LDADLTGFTGVFAESESASEFEFGTYYNRRYEQRFINQAVLADKAFEDDFDEFSWFSDDEDFPGSADP
jgi:hypothetical protein